MTYDVIAASLTDNKITKVASLNASRGDASSFLAGALLNVIAETNRLRIVPHGTYAVGDLYRGGWGVIVNLKARAWNLSDPKEPGVSCTYEGVGVDDMHYGNVTSINTLFKMAGIKQVHGKEYTFTIRELE